MAAAKRRAKPAQRNKSLVEEEIIHQIGIRELRQDASRVFALVEAGATFTVTNHGRVVGIIKPPEKSQLDKWIEDGQVTPAKRGLDLRNWNPSKPYDGPDLLATFLKERREARY